MQTMNKNKVYSCPNLEDLLDNLCAWNCEADGSIHDVSILISANKTIGAVATIVYRRDVIVDLAHAFHELNTANVIMDIPGSVDMWNDYNPDEIKRFHVVGGNYTEWWMAGILYHLYSCDTLEEAKERVEQPKNSFAANIFEYIDGKFVLVVEYDVEHLVHGIAPWVLLTSPLHPIED